MRECQISKEQRQVDCTCQFVDVNGVNSVILPEHYLHKSQRSPAPQSGAE